MGTVGANAKLSQLIDSSGIFTNLRIKHIRKLFSFFDKLHRNRIDAMTGVLAGHVFAFEDVAEMSSTMAAQDFYPTAIGIGMFYYSTFDFIIKAGPAAAGGKLIC